MQNAGSDGFVDRLVGVARLDMPTYEAIEHDRTETPAAGVVALASIAGGFGEAGRNGIGDWVGGIVVNLVLWAAFAAVASFVSTRVLPAASMNVSLGQVLRTLGFAAAPLLLWFLGFVPGLGGLLAMVGLGWFFVTATVLLRQALDVGMGRAIAVAAVSLVPAALTATVINNALGAG